MMRRGARALWVRAACVLCLGFVLLASGRGLAPGLCANAVAARVDSAAACGGATLSGAAPCCAALHWGGQRPAPAEAPAPPGKAKCALCSLVCTPCEPLSPVASPTPAEPAGPTPVPLCGIVASTLAVALPALRAPPGLLLPG